MSVKSNLFSRLTRTRLLFPLLLIVLLLPALYWYTTRPKETAAWWDESWVYRKRIDISNPGGSDLTDFQVSFTLDTTDTSKFKSNCADLRITGVDGNLLPFWIEENNPGCGNASTKVWVKLPSIPSSGTYIYAYYGNPSASMSSDHDGERVFVMFDDFSADNDSWSDYAGSSSIGSGLLTFSPDTSSNWNHTTTTQQDQLTSVNSYVVEHRYRSNPSAGGTVFRYSDQSNWWGIEMYNNNIIIRGMVAGTDTTKTNPSYTFTPGQYFILSSKYNATDHSFTVSVNGSQVVSATMTGAQQLATNNAVGVVDHSNFGPSNSDWILVRKFSSTQPTTTTQSEEIGPGPIAYWKFDEGTGTTANDSSSSQKNGSLSGSPEWRSETECVSGKCLFFDGTNVDVVNITDSGSTDPLDLGTKSFTVSFWGKPLDYTYPKAVFPLLDGNAPYTDGAGHEGWSISDNYTASGVNISFNDGTNRVTSTLTFNSGSQPPDLLNNWTHFVYVFNRTTNQVTAYINGTLQNSNVDISSVTGSISNTSNLKIGYGTGWKTHGFIDEFKIYPYAHTADQVLQDYNQYANSIGGGSSSLSNGLVGYWKMDESSGTSVADASGNGNNGTLTNAQEAGTSDASGNTTTTLIDSDGSLSTTDDAYNGMILRFTAACGSITSGTERVINDYTGSSKTFTVANAWASTPNSCAYEIRHQIEGKFGNAQKFDGTNDYVSIAHSDTLDSSEFTISTWVKRTGAGTGSNQFIVLKNAMYGLSWNGTILRYYDNAYHNSTVALTQDQWYHITLVHANDKTYLYSNGELNSSDTNIGTPNLSYNAVLEIAKQGIDYFQGVVDEVRIYNRALSASEVQALYTWAPGPVGYWDLNEGSGTTAYDKSTNSLHGTLTNGPTWSTGKYGKAVNLDGSDDYISIATNSLLDIRNEITYSTWVYSRQTGKDTHIIQKANSPGGYILYVRTTDKIGAIVYHTGSHTTPYTSCGSNYTLPQNQWVYLTVQFKRGQYIKIYANGQLQQTCSPSYPEPLGASGTSLLLGYRGWYGASDEEFNGLMDEVKIYNYIRTPEQIRQDMTGTASPGVSSGSTPPQPIAHWKLDEGHGSTSRDTISDYSLTLTGTDWKTQTNCKSNNCLYYSGADLAQANLDFNNQDYTLSAFIYPTATSSFSQIIGGDVGNNTNDGLILNNNNICFHEYSTNSVDHSLCSTTNPIQLDTWSHVALTMSGSTVRVYYNGQLVASETYATSNSSTKVNIGGNSSLLEARTFDGYIDEVKIYDSALTEEQIKQDMNAGSTLAVGTTANEAADLNDGAGNPPILEWKLDEKTGTTANDTSGNNNTGSATNTTWKSTKDCKQGACLSFTSSSSSYVTTSTDPGTMASGTYSLWVKPSTLSANMGWIDSTFDIFQWTGNILYFRAGNQSSVSISDWNPNTWYHLALVWNGTNYYGYVNGKQVTSGTQSGSRTGQISIGRVDGGYYFTGLIDHVKIYNYARTPAQIAYDYNRGEPIAHWKMDECQGSTIHDSSDNGDHGTLTVTTTGGNTNGIGTCTTSTSAWGSGSSGKFGASLYLDGDNDKIVVTDNDTLDGFTSMSVFLWAKPSISSVKEIIIKHNTGTSDINWELYQNGNNLGARINGTSDTCTSTGNKFTTNTWHHIGMVWTGTEIKIYIDGVLSSNSCSRITSLPNTAGNLSIGSYESGSYSFNGQLDDARIYNYALSEAQVKKIMNEGSALRFGD